MFDLFGETMPLPAKFFIAFAVVLALIGITAWLVRRFGANRLGGANARGRQPRLAVIDAAPVDGRRRLVLIRRDNVEHLLMIGGPTDVVVEQNIVRAASSSSNREPARAEPPMREPQIREPSVRQSPAPSENAWPLQPAGEPTPVAAPRPYRATPTEEPWLQPEPGARPRPADSNTPAGNSLVGLAVELSTKLTPPEVSPPAPVRQEPPVVRNSPPPMVAPEPVAVAPEQNDHNLAEMAQQLEAALRRAPMPEGRPPVTDALAQPPKSPVPTRDYKLRLDPKFESRPDTKFEARQEAKFESKLEPKLEPKFDPMPEPTPDSSARPDLKPDPKFDARPEPHFEPRPAEPRQQPPAPAKNVFDNLEEEMASLLGRPPGKT